MSRDGQVLLLLSSQGGVSLVSAGRQITALRTDGRKIVRIALSPDGKMAAVAAKQEMTRIDLMAGRCTAWRTNTAAITALALHSDGQQIVVGDANGKVTLFREASDGWVGTNMTFESPVRQVAFLKALFLLAAADDNNRWRVWRTDGSAAGESQDEADRRDEVCFAANGTVWTAISDGPELNGDDLHSCVIGHGGDAKWEEIHRSSTWRRTIAQKLATDDQGRTCLVRLKSAQVALTGHLPDREVTLARPGVIACSLAADGTKAITVHRDGTLRRWETEHLTPSGSPAYAPPGVSRIVSNFDASRVVALAAGNVYLYSFGVGGAHSNRTNTSSVHVKALSPTFASLAKDESRARSKTGWLLSRQTANDLNEGRWVLRGPRGERRFQQSMTEGEITNVDTTWENSHFSIMPSTHAALSPDGSTLATAAAAQAVRIWDVTTGKRRCELHSDALPGDQSFPFSLPLSRDGARVLVAYKVYPGDHADYQLFDGRTGAGLAQPVAM